MNFKVEKINGASDEKYTCGVFNKHVDIEGEPGGLLVSCILLEASNLEGVENVSSYLHDGFETDSKKMAELSGSPLEKISEIAQTASERFKQVGAEADFAILFFYKEALYIARRGSRIKVNVYRVPKSFEIDFENGSGKINVGDLVLVSTDKFIETFDSSVFAKEGEIDFEDVIDGLATDISALSNQSEVGALFIKAGGGRGKEAAASHENEHEEKVEVKTAVAGDNVQEITPTVLPSNDDSEGDGLREAPAPSLLGSLFSKIGLEVSRLRVGDIGALFRLRRVVMLLAAVLILVLCFSGFMTVRSRMETSQKAEFSTHFNLAQEKYNEALGVSELNQEKARKLLVEAQDEVNKALGVIADDSRAISLKSDIAAKLKDLENMATVNFESFWDGRGRVASVSRGSGDFFVFADDGVWQVDSGGQESEVSQTNASGGGFVYDNTLFLLSGNKILKMTTSGDETEIASGVEASDISVFFGNVYSISGDQILKFVPIADGYAEGANYLETGMAFGGESRFAIDGSIWVTKGKDVLQFTRGVSDNFSISGISGIGTLGEIYTNPDTDKIYVIDKANSALLVIGKDGLYEKSYNSVEFAKAVDLYVDEENGKMYIASGSKILTADL